MLPSIPSDTVLIVDNIRHVFLSKLVSVVSSIFQIRIYKSSNALFHKKKTLDASHQAKQIPPLPRPLSPLEVNVFQLSFLWIGRSLRYIEPPCRP